MMRFAPCVAAATVLCFASSPSGTTLSKPIAPWMINKPERPKKARPGPDKNQYWLFNPVPKDQMRRFSTDRP